MKMFFYILAAVVGLMLGLGPIAAVAQERVTKVDEYGCTWVANGGFMSLDGPPHRACTDTRGSGGMVAEALFSGLGISFTPPSAGNPGDGPSEKGPRGNRPGHGYGDRNHDHSGPPGRSGRRNG